MLTQWKHNDVYSWRLCPPHVQNTPDLVKLIPKLFAKITEVPIKQLL